MQREQYESRKDLMIFFAERMVKMNRKSGVREIVEIKNYSGYVYLV